MQHCNWDRTVPNVFPASPFNTSSFYIDDILSSSSQKPQSSLCSSTICEPPKPHCISPAFHLASPSRTYPNLNINSPFSPYNRPPFSFQPPGFQAPSIPSVYEAYSDHSEYITITILIFCSCFVRLQGQCEIKPHYNRGIKV